MDINRLKRRAAAHGLVVRRDVINPVTLKGKFKYGTFPTGKGVMSDELDNVAQINAAHPLRLDAPAESPQTADVGL